MATLESKWVGKRVRVSKWAMGTHRGKEGVVVRKCDVPHSGRGVPKIAGHYKPMEKDELAIVDDRGNLFTEYAHSLEVIPYRRCDYKDALKTLRKYEKN